MDKLPYKAKWFPIGPIFAIVCGIIVILAQNFQAFLADQVDWGGECMAFRMFEDGKCTNCGYCSSIRASINALYSQKKGYKIPRIRNNKKVKRETIQLIENHIKRRGS